MTEGTPIAVTAKLNMTDGVRGGITVEESLKTAKWLEEDGGLDAIELTAGSSLVNPMYLFRGDAPIKEFAKRSSSRRCGGVCGWRARRCSANTPTARRICCATPSCSAPN